MAKETIEEFYLQKFNYLPDNLRKDVGHFNVFRLQDTVKNGKLQIRYSRRDFYKIMLIRGNHIYHYADKSLEVSGSTLLFFNPDIPYTYELLTADPTGHFCIFKESFFSEYIRAGIKDLPVFALGAKPAYLLNKKQDKLITAIFEKMSSENDSDYLFRYDLIRSYIMEIVHQALKMQPAESLYRHGDANARITAVFTELLERQFPIESPAQQFTMRSASQYAGKMNVHVNHLNRAIRLTTGKTTTSHIMERIANEAKALLRHTNWNIAEISYCLGFEEPAHFNHFFRKHADMTPSAYRN